MSSFKILFGSRLSSLLRQRLVVSGVTTRNYSAVSYVLSKQLRIPSSNRLFLNAGVNNIVYNGVHSTSSFHSSGSRKRTTEAHIDQSLHRLDSEIRRVGRIRRQEVDEILEDIKEMKKATSSQSLMIIRCCGELIPEEPPSRRTELVQQVWKTLEALKVPMDVSHYNALLRVYLENEYKFNPTEFLQDLTSKGIEPNRVTYQRLITRFCQDGDIDGASTILQHMKDKQMPINEYVFNSLILGHGQSNDMESAEGILSVMRQAGLEPNDDTYVTLMTCYAKQGDIENIHRIAKECADKEIFLIDRDFLNVIYTLAANNHQDLIDQVLPYMRKHSGYNQEVTTLIFRLTNIGQEEIAYKLLGQMVPIIRDGEPVPSGNFFVKHLVQLGRPSDVIIKYCNKLQDEGLNKWALSRAGEFALNGQHYDTAVDIIEAMKERGFPLRQHYFWPLIAAAKSEEEIHSALKFMRSMRIVPNNETLREYVIPNVLEKTKESVEKALHTLSSVTGVSLGTISASAMFHVLFRDDVKRAAQFAMTYRISFGNPPLRRAIVDSYIRTKDASTFVQIIGSSVIDGGDDGARENVGMMLMELVESIRTTQAKVALLQPVLKELLNNGLGLSNSGSELLQNHLGEALTPELTNTILQLTSPELTPKIPLIPDSGRRQVGGQQGGYLEDKSSEELEEMLAEAQRKNGNTKGIKKALLYCYCREKQAEKLVKLKAEMDKEEFVYTTGMQAMFLDLFCHAEMLNEAKEAYEALSKMLDFTMDDLKILRYAFLLQSKGDLEGCINIIKNTGRDESRKPQGAQQQALVWKILNSVAEEGNPAKVKEVFNVLNERNLTPVTAVTLGPIIKAYLVKDDITGALEEFEGLAKQHRVTPWRQELFCRFIKMEDADRLQKMMDISTSIHGEVNSMYDLVFAFIDCGKLRQARKILETPGLRARNDKIELFCQRYFQENRVGELENLIQVTKDLMDVDRNTMYFYLLQAYCKQGDPDKALSVWTSMQEENVQPSAELLIYLADFLRKNNHPVPFVIPDESEIQSEADAESWVQSKSEPQQRDRGRDRQAQVGLPKTITEFRRCIDMNDIDRALQLKQRMDSEGTSLNITDNSLLIDRLARAERLNEATKLTEQMLSTGVHPHIRALKFLMARLGTAGDVNSLERLDDKLSTDLKRQIMFNSRLCLAYTNAGRGKEFFEKSIKPMVQSGVDEDTSSSSSSDEEAGAGGDDQDELGKVPVFGCVSLMMKNENLVPEFKKLAQDANPTHKRGLNNALWAFHMLKRELNAAKEVWENLKNEDRILFRSVMFEARANKDIELAQLLASQALSAGGIGGRSKASAVSCAVDVLVECNQAAEALKLFSDSLNVVQLEDYTYGFLRRFKERAQAANLQFPYEIPDNLPDQRRSQSRSS